MGLDLCSDIVQHVKEKMRNKSGYFKLTNVSILSLYWSSCRNCEQCGIWQILDSPCHWNLSPCLFNVLAILFIIKIRIDLAYLPSNTDTRATGMCQCPDLFQSSVQLIKKFIAFFLSCANFPEPFQKCRSLESSENDEHRVSNSLGVWKNCVCFCLSFLYWINIPFPLGRNSSEIAITKCWLIYWSLLLIFMQFNNKIVSSIFQSK